MGQGSHEVGDASIAYCHVAAWLGAFHNLFESLVSLLYHLAFLCWQTHIDAGSARDTNNTRVRRQTLKPPVKAFFT